MGKSMGAAEFKAACLRVIRQMGEDGEPVTITNRGRPVAVLTPPPPTPRDRTIIGALRGTVLGYDAPFVPAADPSDWTASVVRDRPAPSYSSRPKV